MSTDATSPAPTDLSLDFTGRADSTLRELHAQAVDAVVTGQGLARVAELTASAAGGPVLIVAPQLGGPWLGPRDHLVDDCLAALELTLIDRLRDPHGAPPRELAWEVPIAGKGIEGVVALLRTDEPVRPAVFEYLHVAALAALTESALAEARYSAGSGVWGSLMKDLRSRDDVGRDEIIRRGALLGCSLGRGAVAICAAVRSQGAAQVLSIIGRECSDALAAYEDTMELDEDVQRLYALVPGSREREQVTDAGTAALTLARRIGVQIGRHATVGLSSYCADPAGLPGAIQEAELMLEVLLQSGAPLAGEIGNNGTYRLLFGLLRSRPEELRLLYRDTVAPLVGYDDQYHTELVATLETYLSRNCNMNATAAALFAHRHTIAYRLERIRELTGLDPALSEDRERLGLGLKAYRLIRLRLPR